MSRTTSMGQENVLVKNRSSPLSDFNVASFDVLTTNHHHRQLPRASFRVPAGNRQQPSHSGPSPHGRQQSPPEAQRTALTWASLSKESPGHSVLNCLKLTGNRQVLLDQKMFSEASEETWEEFGLQYPDPPNVFENILWPSRTARGQPFVSKAWCAQADSGPAGPFIPIPSMWTTPTPGQMTMRIRQKSIKESFKNWICSTS